MQTYQIEIDPSVLVHKGVQYEPIAFCSPRTNVDEFVNRSGMIVTAYVDVLEPRLIVRPVWQWPEWLGGAAIAMDADGDAWWFEKRPQKNDYGNFHDGGQCANVSTICIINPSFAPPPLKPGEIVWNPKYKRNNESE